MKFRVQDQVVMRRPILHGRGSNLIKTGTILAFADAEQTKAIVTFPADRTRLTVPVDQLEPVRSVYGRSRVNLDPVSRQIGWLR